TVSDGRASEHALVSDPARDTVRVEALEQELRRLAGGPEEVAEACQRDAPCAPELVHEDPLCVLVRRARNAVAVADAHEPALRFQDPGQGRVLELDGHETEAGFELCRFLLTRAQRARGPAAIELCAAPFEPEPRDDVGAPRLVGRGHTRIERIGSVDSTFE